MSPVTWRAVGVGLLFGLAISALTYLNDQIVRQTMLIGNHLPIVVFGGAVLLLLGVNPLLRLIGRGAPLRRGEVCLIVAIALASCGWPGSNLYRVYTGIAAMPGHWVKDRPSWQANQIMSYVPGGPADLAPGQVADWPAFAEALIAAGEATEAGDTSADATLATLWTGLGDDARQRLRQVAGSGVGDADSTKIITAGINDVLGAGMLAADTAASRAALVEATGRNVRPPPAGSGVLLGGGRAEVEAREPLVGGGQSKSVDRDLNLVPWSDWWPVIRLWGGAALLIGLCSLCLAVIVHPQWSRRELLPYPIARFVEEAAERREGAWLPDVARNKLFWFAMVVPLALHSVNGLHAWFPQVPDIPLSLSFGPLRQLFPTARQVSGANAYFEPTIYLSVIAFSFFLTTPVSFSLGASMIAWLFLGSLLLSSGVPLKNDIVDPGQGTLLRFGGFLGMAMMIGYTGRRYYLQVARRMVTGGKSAETPASAVWAARALIVLTAGLVVLIRTGGVGWVLAVAFVLMALLIVLVMARVVAETGLVFMQSYWLPASVMVGLAGFDAIGPTAFLVLAVGSAMLVGDTREAVMPYLVNGLRLADQGAAAKPGKAAWPLLTMLVIGFLVAGFVTLWTQYDVGINIKDAWATNSLPSTPFKEGSRLVSTAAAEGSLSAATTTEGAARLGLIELDASIWPWALLGVVLVIAAAAARLRLPWWPIHPVMFLVWGTYPMTVFAFSFLIGWLVKLGVMRSTGARGYQAVRPMMIGIIAGELLAGLLWIAIGGIYFLVEGKTPVSYTILPQ